MSLLRWIKSLFGCNVQEYNKSNDLSKELYKVEPTLDSEQVLQDLEDAVNNVEKPKKKKEEIKTRKHWYNNGIKHKLIKEGDPIPKGFVKGRIKIKKECNVGKTRSKKS